MDNDNGKRYSVTNMDGSNERFIDAHGFEVEEGSGAVIFYDADDKLVARLFNVQVHQVTA